MELSLYIRVEWKSLFLGQCLKSCLTVPKHCMRNFSSICEVWGSAQNRWSFGNAKGDQKIKFIIFFNFGVRMTHQDEGIPNLVSELKSDDNWPLFWPKNLSKALKTGKTKFARFRPFLAKKGLNVVRFQFWDQIWNPLILAHLSDPKLKENWKFYFLAPL